MSLFYIVAYTAYELYCYDIMKIKLVLSFLIIINFSSCVYYSYSSDKNERKFHEQIFKEETEFGTIYIDISHLKRTYNNPVYRSDIRFLTDYADEDLDITILDVDIKHTYFMNKTIKPREKRVGDFENSTDLKLPIRIPPPNKYKRSVLYCIQYYSKTMLYSSLREDIKIKLDINGKIYDINKSYDLYYKYDDNYLSIMMTR